MTDIKWKEGAVCFAGGSQWSLNDGVSDALFNDLGAFHPFDELLSAIDFQLNTIKQGDYIEASELDTDQKYNDAVDVFALFGFDCVSEYSSKLKYDALGCFFDGCLFAKLECKELKRKLTDPQLMAIGQLKRAMLDEVESQLIEINSTSESTNSSEPKKSIDYLNECMEVQNQRGEQYDSKGTGERSFAAAASAFNAMTGQNLKGSDVCLLLSCVKAVRQYSDPARVHEDSLLDLVSYASLWAEEINKELK